MNDLGNGFATAGMFGIILTGLIVALALTVFFVWMFWRVFTKTGMNGALGLLCLIPSIGPLICLLILAFGRWPIEDLLQAHVSGAVVQPPPPPAPPPGTSVMPS